jgi:galactoside O-acetyltransferase
MKIGCGSKISPKASIYGADRIEIGENCRIDDFCVLSAGKNGYLRIGSHVHIANYVALYGGGGIEIADFVGLSGRVAVFSENDNYTGSAMSNPCIPDRYRLVTKGRVRIGRHVLIGTGSTIMPGVQIGDGASVGAHSFVNRPCDPWSIYAGVPARRLRDRDRDGLLRMEQEFLTGYASACASKDPTGSDAEGRPLVSVVCLTYNHKEYIRQALDGILKQRCKFRYEAIVHDDASTDGTAAIIREYAARHPLVIRPIFQNENQFRKTGTYPMMPAYELARGKYIAECDGDDYWTDPHKLQMQADFMEAHPECSLCHHPYLIQRGDALDRPSKEPPLDYTPDELIGMDLHGYGIGSCARMYRNLFRTERECHENEAFIGDYPINVLMGLHGAGKFIGSIRPSVYRKHGRNSWAGLPAAEIIRRTDIMHRRLYNEMVRRGDSHASAIRARFIRGFDRSEETVNG